MADTNSQRKSIFTPPPIDKEEFRGVGLFLEQQRGEIHPVAWELAGIGRKLADKLDTHLAAIIVGH